MKTNWHALRYFATGENTSLISIDAFTHEEDARRAVTFVTHGIDSGVVAGEGTVQPLTVYDSYEEWLEKYTEEVRQRAKAKLNKEEIRILGLNT